MADHRKTGERGNAERIVVEIRCDPFQFKRQQVDRAVRQNHFFCQIAARIINDGRKMDQILRHVQFRADPLSLQGNLDAGELGVQSKRSRIKLGGLRQKLDGKLERLLLRDLPTPRRVQDLETGGLREGTWRVGGWEMWRDGGEDDRRLGNAVVDEGQR